MKLTSVAMAQLIKAALDEDGLTQAEFCRRVGVSEKHMSRVLSGHSAAAPASLDYWAYALGRSFSVTLDVQDSEETQ